MESNKKAAFQRPTSNVNGTCGVPERILSQMVYGKAYEPRQRDYEAEEDWRHYQADMKLDSEDDSREEGVA